MRLTKIYTRTGDKGDTGLAGGVRVGKDCERIEAYGTVDELNSVVGIVRAFLKNMETPFVKETDVRLYKMQNILFVVGADLATAPGKEYKTGRLVVQAKQVTELEQWMDEWQADLKPLPEFILPGGGKTASFLHQARTVCRRAERAVIRLSRKEEVRPEVIHYLNRLGDAFFVLARWVAQQSGEAETMWDRKIE